MHPSYLKKKWCPKCGAAPGELHVIDCELEQCPACGHYGGDECSNRSDYPRIPWSGLWPGTEDCVRLNLCVTGDGFHWDMEVRDRDDPFAIPDFNTLYAVFVWDVVAQRFVRPKQKYAHRTKALTARKPIKGPPKFPAVHKKSIPKKKRVPKKRKSKRKSKPNYRKNT